jgi:hypothetical protein
VGAFGDADNIWWDDVWLFEGAMGIGTDYGAMGIVINGGQSPISGIGKIDIGGFYFYPVLNFDIFILGEGF